MQMHGLTAKLLFFFFFGGNTHLSRGSGQESNLNVLHILKEVSTVITNRQVEGAEQAVLLLA